MFAGVCITLWWFSCFTPAASRLSIVFARWHHCAPPCDVGVMKDDDETHTHRGEGCVCGSSEWVLTHVVWFLATMAQCAVPTRTVALLSTDTRRAGGLPLPNRRP